MSTYNSKRMNLSHMSSQRGGGSTAGKSQSLSPIKMTSEKMQMNRRDVKPGNGTSLISYQNHANLKKHLIEMRPIVDDQPNENYLKE